MTFRSRIKPVIFPHGAKCVNDFTIGNSYARMRHVGRNRKDHARSEPVGRTGYRQFEHALQHVYYLLVWVGMLRQRAIGPDSPMSDGHAFGVDKPAGVTRKDFLLR